jgi:hypothetical protein
MRSFVVKSVIYLPILLCATAFGETDKGSAAQMPYSGYWWQNRAGGLTGPLGLYDQVTGSKAAPWDLETHVSPDTPAWHGRCHAQAAASCVEKEPTQARSVQNVAFEVGDLKGLLCACHEQDVANSYGDRYGDGNGSEDPQDLKPDELWRLLQMYVKQRKLALILDLESGDQVWNYPVYQYEVTYDAAGSGWYDAELKLVVADNNVDPSFVGTEPALHSYTFRFQMQDGSIVMGSGEWTGASSDDHPDFGWYPYVAVAENPEVDIAQVAKIVGYEVGGSNPPADDGQPTSPPVVNPPTETERPPTPNPVSTETPTGNNTTQVLTQWNDLLSPNELVSLVANKTSSFGLDVFVDRNDGGRYSQGEPIKVSLRCKGDGYLYLFDVGPQGELSLIFPLPGLPNRIRKDTLYDIPWEGEKPWFLAGVPGQHDLKAIVTTKPIKLTGFTTQTKPADYDQGAAKKRYPTKSQEIYVYPSSRRRVLANLAGFFRKGLEEEKTSQKKVTGFAQDVCSYFVLSPAGTQKDKPNQTQTQDSGKKPPKKEPKPEPKPGQTEAQKKPK